MHGGRLSLRAALAGLALALALSPAGSARADDAPPLHVPVGPTPGAGVTAEPATFDALAAIEEEDLAAHRASGHAVAAGAHVLLLKVGLHVRIVILRAA